MAPNKAQERAALTVPPPQPAEKPLAQQQPS
jgi:hypothetical protein